MWQVELGNSVKRKLKQINHEIALTLQTIGGLENILNTEVTE